MLIVGLALGAAVEQLLKRLGVARAAPDEAPRGLKDLLERAAAEGERRRGERSRNR
jgi:hypothetical protein